MNDRCDKLPWTRSKIKRPWYDNMILISGENIKYYPKDSHFIGVDCNVHLKRYFETNPDKISNVKVKSLIISETDDLSVIADASVDAVIATLVLCNVNNVAHLLTEIRRILVPVSKLHEFKVHSKII